MQVVDLATREDARRPPASSSPTARQFVTFVVAGRNYGIEIAAVREIIRWTRVTPLPNQPLHARGVLNLRGTIVPVHDLRAQALGRADRGDRTTTSSSSPGSAARRIGLLVDAVSDILDGGGRRPAPAAERRELGPDRRRWSAPTPTGS